MDKSATVTAGSIASQLITQNYGNICLWEDIAESTGLTKTLRSCFEQEYRDICTVTGLRNKIYQA
jgi:hypothetical protein